MVGKVSRREICDSQGPKLLEIVKAMESYNQKVKRVGGEDERSYIIKGWWQYMGWGGRVL